MGVELSIAPEAELDITETYAWYESVRIGLGEEFLGSVDASIERIRRQPLGYPVVYETYRRALIRRFPYAVFFESTETKVIILCRISHVAGSSEMAGTSTLICPGIQTRRRSCIAASQAYVARR